MAKICFQCKKELGKFTLNAYPPNNLKVDGKVIPPNMTDKDVVCNDCYKKIPIAEKQRKFEKVMGVVGLIAVFVLLGLDCYWNGIPCVATNILYGW